MLLRACCFLAGLSLLPIACNRSTAVSGQEQAALRQAPEVPPPLRRKHATRVIVQLEVQEVTKTLSSGATYNFWTFGGSVPGNFIRVRQGDLIEFHLNNHPNNTMPHNIDLHAVTGPGGGAVASFTAPGHSSIFTFTAANAGLFVYHCAAAPVGLHIANGMYGLILVEPPEGLPKVDREYYVMQGEFYTNGAFGEAGTQVFSMDKALHESPDYVLFNGAVDSLTRENALTAQVGETVRIFFGNGGPNLTSSFHIIGMVLDKVYSGAEKSVQNNVATISVPPGGAAIVEARAQVPGTYSLVDHAIFRAFNKGAVAELNVGGMAHPELLSVQGQDAPYRPGTTLRAEVPKPAGPMTTAQRFAAGERLFAQRCVACHQSNGTGLPGAIPPLAQSDYLNHDKQRAIHTVLKGLTGPVTVNGKTYNSVMPSHDLPDDDIAALLTFVYGSFGNKKQDVLPHEVASVRSGGVKDGKNGT